MASGFVVPISAEYNPKGVVDAQKSLSQFSTDVEQKLGAATQVANKNLKDLDSGLGKVAGSADQSRQVFGAFAGQATAQATMLAGGLGPVGQVLGQIVNQSTQAKLTLSSFAQIAGPIAAVSAAFYGIKTILAENAEQAKLNKKYQEEYTKALLEGKSAAEALAGAQDRVKGVQGFDGGKTRDITRQLLEFGLNLNKTNQLILAGRDAIKEWGRAQEKAGADIKTNRPAWMDLQTVLDFLNDRAKNLGKSTDIAAMRIRFFGEAATQATPPGQGFANVLGNIRDATKNAADAQQELVDRIDESQRALRAALDPIYGNERAQIALQKAEEAYLKAKPNDKARALLDLKQAALDAADAAAKLAEAGPGGPNDKRAAGLAAITEQYQNLADLFKNNPELSRYFANVPGVVGGSTTQGMNGWNIAGPASGTSRGMVPTGGTYTIPSTVVTNNNTANLSYVINVNGAYDPVAIAAQLRRLLNDDAVRRGLKGAVLNSWIVA